MFIFVFCFLFPLATLQNPTECDENILHVLPPPPPTPQNQSLIAHCLEVTPPPPLAHQASSGESSSSRPSSQLSQNGSSGYGSTRSQVAPFGVACVSTRPSPASSSSSESSTNNTNHFEKTRNPNKRVVWWGGGSLRGLPKRAQQEYDIGDVDSIVRSGVSLNPQYASLRIPNRIKHSSHGDLPAYVEEEDPGLDLVEAEVDSEAEDMNNNNNSNNNNQADSNSSPTPTPRVPKSNPSYMNMPFPLRHASSLESQVP